MSTCSAASGHTAANGCKPPREIAERCEAAELRLRSMSALELAEALIKYRRVTGVPFKL